MGGLDDAGSRVVLLLYCSVIFSQTAGVIVLESELDFPIRTLFVSAFTPYFFSRRSDALCHFDSSSPAWTPGDSDSGSSGGAATFPNKTRAARWANVGMIRAVIACKNQSNRRFSFFTDR